MTSEPDETLEIEEKTLRRLAEASLAEAQLARLTDLSAGLGKAPGAAERLATLREQRSELLAKRPSAEIAVDFAQLQLDRAVISTTNRLAPWSILELPDMTEGIYSPPGTSDATGDLITLHLYSGGLAFGGSPGGQLTADSSPPAERWWTRTWRNSVVFPPAPFAGRLYYRFAVDCECNLFMDPVEGGSIQTYVTLATVGDVARDRWTNWQTVGWPIIQTLPSPPRAFGLGNIAVNGSIPVMAGNSAAIAFIYGTTISVEGGWLQLLWGNFGTRYLDASDYYAYGKLEYRFESNGWIEAISGRLGLGAYVNPRLSGLTLA
jgi:hypothetical protein